LRAEITIITKEEGKSLPLLSGKKWVKVIAFSVVDKIAYLKEVNIKFQGYSKLLYEMFSDTILLQNDFFKASWLGTDGQTNTVLTSL